MLDLASIEPQELLSRLVNSEPVRTATEKDQRPSDITSLMFLGSRQQIQDAFQKAGWSPAARLSDQSKLFGVLGDARHRDQLFGAESHVRS